ncbi:Ankyrin repeat domain-containing protein 29 [Papilio machaon]|uniref:Ankyrin repeat domain-containing protein 29 n=1 Tax=Papilio machaon TaxID=76193 RepID=A0A0N1IDY7_PAPMA|nr:Ankyrin repeat domain-containing protein 29 [Papilio machaon]
MMNTEDKCAACLSELKDTSAMYCTCCKDKFHLLCLNLSQKEYNALTEDSIAKWTCDMCRSKGRKGGDKTNTPVRVRTSSPQLNFVTQRNKSRPAPNPSNPTSIAKAPMVSLQHSYTQYWQVRGARLKESRTDVQFHLAALRGDRARLCQLLDTGKVHIDSRDRDGTTPLILSAAMGHTDCVEELLAQGADPACCRTTGTSALFFAAQGGFLDIARLLLDAGADIDAPSTDGGTPLFVACQCGHLPVVEELLQRGANVNSCMKDGATPLFIAAQNGHEEVCARLLRAGAAVDAARADRATPLWIAAQCGHQRVARVLLEHGARVDATRQVPAVSNNTPATLFLYNSLISPRVVHRTRDSAVQGGAQGTRHPKQRCAPAPRHSGKP